MHVLYVYKIMYLAVHIYIWTLLHITEEGAVPDSPQSQKAAPLSPVFSGRPISTALPVTRKRGAIVVQSSDSEAESPVKSSGSPWLSKERAISTSRQNGYSAQPFSRYFTSFPQYQSEFQNSCNY